MNMKKVWPDSEEKTPEINDATTAWPKISIITPSYNQGQFIEETILSIINQNYPNLEYIIIDGGSKDNTVEIIKKFEKHLTYWVSEPDRGQAHAINKGLEKCTGEIFNWINSDDYLEPGSLFAIGKHFAENPQTEVLCGYTHCFYQETGQTSHTYRMGIRKTVADTILNVEMNQPGSFYRMDIVKDLRGVNESLRYVFDDELWFRYLCKNGLQKVSLFDQLVCHFRLHGSSKSIAEGFEKFGEEISAIYYSIAQKLKLPSYIMDEMQKELKPNVYESFEWELEFIEKDIFLAYFCHIYQFTFYKDYNFTAAEESYKLQKAYYTIDGKSIMLYLKLFVIPRVILNKLRKK